MPECQAKTYIGSIATKADFLMFENLQKLANIKCSLQKVSVRNLSWPKIARKLFVTNNGWLIYNAVSKQKHKAMIKSVL